MAIPNTTHVCLNKYRDHILKQIIVDTLGYSKSPYDYQHVSQRTVFPLIYI